jgi:hypothetical protein
MSVTQEQIEKAILWFESMGYHVEESYHFGTLRLELDGFSVELSENEVESRAEQWDYEQSRED